MFRLRRVAGGLCLGLAVSSAVAVALPRQEAAKPAAVASGAALFASSGCAHCHTIDGAGGHVGPDLSGVGRRWKTEAIRKQIEAGGGAMPAYADVLRAEEIDALVAYLHGRRARVPKG